MTKLFGINRKKLINVLDTEGDLTAEQLYMAILSTLEPIEDEDVVDDYITETDGEIDDKQEVLRCGCIKTIRYCKKHKPKKKPAKCKHDVPAKECLGCKYPNLPKKPAKHEQPYSSGGVIYCACCNPHPDDPMHENYPVRKKLKKPAKCEGCDIDLGSDGNLYHKPDCKKKPSKDRPRLTERAKSVWDELWNDFDTICLTTETARHWFKSKLREIVEELRMTTIKEPPSDGQEYAYRDGHSKAVNDLNQKLDKIKKEWGL